MNPQTFKRPPRWWSPRLHRFWLWLWRPVRKRIQRKGQRLVDIEIRGIEHLRKALADGKGILITPNHSGHADPMILYEAAEQLGCGFYFMAAWQVLARHRQLYEEPEGRLSPSVNRLQSCDVGTERRRPMN